MSRILTPEDIWPDRTPEEREELFDQLWNDEEDDDDDI